MAGASPATMSARTAACVSGVVNASRGVTIVPPPMPSSPDAKPAHAPIAAIDSPRRGASNERERLVRFVRSAVFSARASPRFASAAP